ncbi:hypothetical protein EXIGLDRAFT_730819 [Exidia glandulosa HHB12029]|uniref:Uncharacterized protein n=1 Tax=Exidia glandulosa HHB12029 TaxID=1314781 RepID=A0A165C1A1_EXIGL|nr:hypothetical protein EXIGLDRAFT_730819 [Exidia glandulosa HHB12029]
MDDFAAMLDLVPPRSPSPPRSPRAIIPYAVDMPDELLRQIFELAVISNRYAARNLMQVSKWVRAWVIRAFYEIAFVKSNTEVQTLAKRPDRLLAKVQSLWIGPRLKKPGMEVLARMPNITSLALPQPSPKPVDALLHPDVRLRELTLSSYCSALFGSDRYHPLMSFSTSTLCTLTHLRLGHVYENLISQLTSSEVPVLPLLTHLSFDAYHGDSIPRENGVPGARGCRPADEYRRILEAPSRIDLQILVVVVFPGEELHTAELLAMRLPRLVVLIETTGPLKSRGGEWLAAARGERGFWERAARDGRTFRDALPVTS